MFIEVLFAVSIVMMIFGVTWTSQRRRKFPPGPYPWPIIGSHHHFQQMSRECGGQHLAILEMSRRYKSDVIGMRIGSQNLVAVCGKETIQTLLHSEEFDGRPWNEFIKMRNMGMRMGMTFTDGPGWREMRAWFVRSFRSLGFGRTKMYDLVEDELREMLIKLDNGGVRRLKLITLPAVLNVLWALATGKRIDDDEKLQYFIDLMERRGRAFNLAGGILSAIPWIRHIAPEASGYNILNTLNKELKDFLMATIEEHKKNYVPGSDNDLIDMFLNEMYSGKGISAGFHEQQLVVILVDIFLAGTTTTATSLDFLYLTALVFQDVQKRLQEEIDSVVGDRTITVNDKPNLPYMEAVLTECQRMWLITPLIGPRRTLRDTELAGYTIPKNTTVLINIFSINNNEAYFPNPKNFNPERFMKNGVHQTDENLILFGKGKRRCPGEVLARSAVFLLFAGVLQRFDIKPVPGQSPTSIEIESGLTISPKPYEVMLVPRKKKFSS